MYEKLIKEYINKLTEEQIKEYALKKNVALTNDETKIIYLYIKNYWQIFYKGDPEELFKELKEKLQPNTYNEIIKIYQEYKNKIKYN